MPISVVCPGCHVRFKVADKFAGKKGPCPKCKVDIQIPGLNEKIEIHEREHEGLKDREGKLILKPIEREKFVFRPLLVIGISIGVLLLLLSAFLLQSAEETTKDFMAIGFALVIAMPCSMGGYRFLRESELEPYRGKEFFSRTGIVAAVYAVMWGGFYLIPNDLRGAGDEGGIWMIALAISPFVIVGGITAMATLDLEKGPGFIHYGFYLLAYIVLRLLMGLSVL